MTEVQNALHPRDSIVQKTTDRREAETSVKLFSEYLDTVRNATQRDEARPTDANVSLEIPQSVDRRIAQEERRTRNEATEVNFGNIWSDLKLPVGTEHSNIAGRQNPGERSRLGEPLCALNTTSNENAEERNNRTHRTEVRGVGAPLPTRVRVKTDGNGNPVSVRDPLGNWTTGDGGRTWTTGEPHYRVRRGTVGIDGNGVYSFENTDYGVRTFMSPDGTTRREIAASDGATYSYTRNALGQPVAFTDESGEWRMQGNQWVHRDGVRRREGDVEVTSNGRFTFTSRDGTEIRNHRTPQLEEINRLTEEIQQRFRIRIAQEGDVRSDYHRINVAGTPTVEELRTLRSVLERSPVESYNNRMTVWFIRSDEMRPGSAQSHMAHLVSEGSDGPHRCISCQHSGVRRNGSDLVIMPSARQVTEGFAGLEGTLIHELGHYEQSRFFVRSNEAWGTGRQRTPDIERFTNALGWVFTDLVTRERDESNQLTTRRGRSALMDRDGGFWVSGQDSADNTIWRQVVGGSLVNGQLIGGRIRNSGSINNEEMGRRAMIPQGTDYFHEPDEAQANALAMFRMGFDSAGFNRRTLLEISPTLYEVIRAQDQEFIDRGLGRHADGRSRFIRDTDGTLISNTEQNSQRIRELERQWAFALAFKSSR